LPPTRFFTPVADNPIRQMAELARCANSGNLSRQRHVPIGVAEMLQAFERNRQISAAFVPSEGMELIDNDELAIVEMPCIIRSRYLVCMHMS
jgi:hypothetical protein